MRHPARPLVVTSLLVGLTALAGCTSAGAAGADVDEGPTATVEVQNQNWLAMEVYATAAGQRVRLGRLGAGRDRTYALPGRLFEGGPTQVVFEMETVGSEAEVVRETQSIAPGDVVLLVIPNTR